MQLFTTRDAALKLAISQRTLWEHTAPRGPIPCVRIGRSVRYSLQALQDFLKAQEQGLRDSKSY